MWDKIISWFFGEGYLTHKSENYLVSKKYTWLAEIIELDFKDITNVIHHKGQYSDVLYYTVMAYAGVYTFYVIDAIYVANVQSRYFDFLMEMLGEYFKDFFTKKVVADNQWLWSYIYVDKETLQSLVDKSVNTYLDKKKPIELLEEYDKIFGENKVKKYREASLRFGKLLSHYKIISKKLMSLSSIKKNITDVAIIKQIHEQVAQMEAELPEITQKLDDYYRADITEKMSKPVDYFVHELKIWNVKTLLDQSFIKIDTTSIINIIVEYFRGMKDNEDVITNLAQDLGIRHYRNTTPYTSNIVCVKE